MNLGNFFSGIVAKDPTTPPIVREPAPTVDRMAPLQAAISGGHVQSAPTRTANLDPRSVVLSLAREPEAEVEIKKFEPLIEVPPSQPQTQAIAVPEVTLPTPDLTPPTAPVVSERLASIEVIPESSPDHSRVFVNSFLGEINSLLVSGKNLEQLLGEKSAADDEFSKTSSSFEAMRSKRMEVATSIAQLFGDGEASVSEESLKKVSEAYDDYLKSYNDEIEALSSTQRQEINKLNLKINAEKGKIKKMFEGAGGQANVEKVKSVIRMCERLATKAREAVELPGEIKEEISRKVASFVVGDLEGAKMLLGNPSDIVGILVRIYTEPAATKN